jgi:hypothetical protein
MSFMKQELTDRFRETLNAIEPVLPEGVSVHECTLTTQPGAPLTITLVMVDTTVHG